jgi:hypothetical protein
MMTAFSSTNSIFSSASVKSKIAIVVSEMQVVAAVRDFRDTFELMVKSLLSFVAELTVKVRFLMKGLLINSLTFVFPYRLMGRGSGPC